MPVSDDCAETGKENASQAGHYSKLESLSPIQAAPEAKIYASLEEELKATLSTISSKLDKLDGISSMLSNMATVKDLEKVEKAVGTARPRHAIRPTLITALKSVPKKRHSLDGVPPAESEEDDHQPSRNAKTWMAKGRAMTGHFDEQLFKKPPFHTDLFTPTTSLGREKEKNEKKTVKATVFTRNISPISNDEEDAQAIFPVVSSNGSGEPSPHAKERQTVARQTVMRPRSFTPSNAANTNAVDTFRDKLSRGERYQWQAVIWQFLEIPESSLMAQFYHDAQAYFIMFTVLLTLVATVEPSPLPCDLIFALELAIEVVFATEVSLRLIVSPQRSAFFMNIYNLMDILTVLPILLRIQWLPPFGTPQCADPGDRSAGFVLLCLVPVLRLTKIMRRFQAFQLLIGAFKLAVEAMPVLLYTQMLITLTFAALIFFFEPRDNLGQLSHAVWLTIVTMTTVGYGDVTPQTYEGYVLVSTLVICSVILTAFPLGIIGSTFSHIWSERDRILLVQKAKDCMLQWGWNPTDAWSLVNLVDENGDGELNLEEFLMLMKHMQVMMSEDRLVALFNSFDWNHQGSISFREFLVALFPGFTFKWEETAEAETGADELGGECPRSSTGCGVADDNAANSSTDHPNSVLVW